MAKKDLLNVAVAWTEDLACHNAQLAAAIYECARTIPGCRFYIIGTGNIICSTKDATSVVIKSGNIDSNGFVVDLPFVARVLYSLRSSDDRHFYDVIIVITRQRYVRHSSRTSSEHYRDGSGAISLEGWEDSEIEMVASLMLEHVMGHMFLHNDIQIHCECPTCTMTNLSSHDSVLNLIKHRSATFLDNFCPEHRSATFLNHFCPKCQQWIRDSSLWSDQPSEVIRGQLF